MPREVDEWVGKTPDTAIPIRVKLRVLAKFNGKCAETKTKIRAGDEWDCDHIKPLWAGGENRETNLQPLLKEPHKEKTAKEAGERSKADRLRAKHLGIYPKTRGNARIQSRGFNYQRG